MKIPKLPHGPKNLWADGSVAEQINGAGKWSEGSWTPW
jgi:hypothetical protein